jgi:hypothetical protein
MIISLLSAYYIIITVHYPLVWITNLDSKKTEARVEAEGGHKTGVPEGSSRSRCVFSFKPTVAPSHPKKGSEKLKEMKKVNGIYGDWLE